MTEGDVPSAVGTAVTMTIRVAEVVVAAMGPGIATAETGRAGTRGRTKGARREVRVNYPQIVLNILFITVYYSVCYSTL